MDQVRLAPSYLWYMTLYDSFIRSLSQIMTNIEIFLINCTTLSRNLSVEPKNKEKKIIFPHRIRAFFSGKTIEFAGVFLNMIDCLRMQIKLSPYGSIGATRGEDKTKTLKMYFCHKCYPFNYSWKHLESDLEINFFCFLPFWNEKSLNAWFPMTYFNLTEKHFFLSLFLLKWFCFSVVVFSSRSSR